MQNEESIEKMDIIDGTNSVVSPRLPSRQSKIYRIRKILLILLSILFAFDLTYLIFNIHAYIDNSLFSHYFKNNYELLWTLVSIIYYAFGLLMTYQYYRTGLYVFAWIGTIFLIFICTVAGIICVAAFYTEKQVNVVDMDIIGLLIFIIIFIISAILLFGWIGIIFLVLNCFVFVLLLFSPFHTKLRPSNNNNRFYTPRYVIFIIFWIFISILLLNSVRLAFKLSKLMINIQHEAKEPMLIDEI